MATFEVNWKLEGFRNKIHQLGAKIVAEFDEVKHLVDAGVLTMLGENTEIPDTPVDLSALSNDELVTYAKEKFGFELDSSLEREAMLTEIAGLADNAPDNDGAGSETTLADMTKAQLIAFAKDKHNVVLKPSLSHAALVVEVTALEAKVQQ